MRHHSNPAQSDDAGGAPMSPHKPAGKPDRAAKIRILIADDHPVVREGLAALINRSPDMKVIGEATDGKQAVLKFFQHCPDVLLLDLRMPKLNGIEVIRAIFMKEPNAKVIMLSTYNGDEDVYQALKAGAKAYLLKDSPREELLESIRSVYRGGDQGVSGGCGGTSGWIRPHPAHEARNRDHSADGRRED